MHLQPNRNYISNDDVQTPPELARRVVAHFQPCGRLLEPCAGHGQFLNALRAHARPTARAPRPTTVAWAEIKRGRDFFAWSERVDWVVTNPPWSQFRAFLQHAMAVSDHVVFLVTINHLWTRARIGDVRAAGFGLREIVLLQTPASFPPLGFQLGAVHLARSWQGGIRLTDWTTPCRRRRESIAPRMRHRVARPRTARIRVNPYSITAELLREYRRPLTDKDQRTNGRRTKDRGPRGHRCEQQRRQGAKIGTKENPSRSAFASSRLCC